MNGNKISDFVSILNKLLVHDTVLSNSDRQELLNFLVEEKIKSVVVYSPDVFENVQSTLYLIETKKQELTNNHQYETAARLRDLEKSCVRVIQLSEEFKSNNINATFAYGLDGLSLYVLAGEKKHVIEEIEKLGLHIIFFSQTLNKMQL